MTTFICLLAGLLALTLVPVAGRLMEESDRRERAIRERGQYLDEWVCFSASVALYIAAGAIGVAVFCTVLVVNVARVAA